MDSVTLSPTCLDCRQPPLSPMVETTTTTTTINEQGTRSSSLISTTDQPGYDRLHSLPVHGICPAEIRVMVYEALVVVVVGKVFYTTDDYSAKERRSVSWTADYTELHHWLSACGLAGEFMTRLKKSILGEESIRATYQISSQGGNLLPNCFSSIMWSCGRVLWVRRRTFDATWARFMSLGPSTTVFLGVRDEGTINSRDTASLKSSLSKYSSTKCTQNYNVSAV